MERIKTGFTYTVETIKGGVVVDTFVVENLMPYEGIDYIIDSALRAGTQIPTFYVGLYEGAYTPRPEDLMSTFVGLATECESYVEAARPVLTLAQPANGETENSANKAVFTGSTNGKVVAGGFISSSPVKGGATGVLVSAVRFPSPRPLDAGTILRVTCGFSIIST